MTDKNPKIPDTAQQFYNYIISISNNQISENEFIESSAELQKFHKQLFRQTTFIDYIDYILFHDSLDTNGFNPRSYIMNLPNKHDELDESNKYFFMYNVAIIPSIFSRIGDVEIAPGKIDVDKLKVIFQNHMIFLKYIQQELPSSLPSAADAFKIDSKIYYMKYLRDAQLCDPNTVICYGFKKEGKLILDETSETILKSFINSSDGSSDESIKGSSAGTSDESIKGSSAGSSDESSDNKYFVKTAFSGSSACAYQITIEKKLKLEDINKDLIVKDKATKCIGYHLGFLIQPKNPYFDNKNSIGELRCFCYKGNIISICISCRLERGYPYYNDEYRFNTIAFHKSLSSVIKKRVKSIRNLTSYIDGVQQTIKQTINEKQQLYDFLETVKPDEEYKYTLDEYYVGEQSLEYMKQRKQEELNEIFPPVHFKTILKKLLDSKICGNTYTTLKTNLNLDGVLHRIDLINANEEYTEFYVNEVENINFGGVSDKAFYSVINENNFFHFKKADPVDTNSKHTVDISEGEDNKIMQELHEPYSEDKIKIKNNPGYETIKRELGNFHPDVAKNEMFPIKIETYLFELESITSQETHMREILLSYLPDNDPTRENLTAFGKKFKELSTKMLKKIEMEKYEKRKAAIKIQRKFRESLHKKKLQRIGGYFHKKTQKNRKHKKKNKKTQKNKKTKKHKKTKIQKYKKTKNKKQKTKNKKTKNTKHKKNIKNMNNL